MTAWSFTALLAFCRWPQSLLAPRASSAWTLKLAGTSDTQSCGVSLLSCSPVARFRCCFYRLPAQYFPLCKICGIRRDARQKNGNRDGSKAAFLWITAAKQPRFRYEEKGASCTNTRSLRHRGLQWPALPSCAELLAYRRSFLINVLMKKRTRVLTNCGALARELAKYQCDKSHVLARSAK